MRTTALSRVRRQGLDDSYYLLMRISLIFSRAEMFLSKMHIGPLSRDIGSSGAVCIL